VLTQDSARYRVFLMVAALFTILVVRLARTGTPWQGNEQIEGIPAVQKGEGESGGTATLKPGETEDEKDEEKVFKSLVIPKPVDTTSAKVEVPKTAALVLSETRTGPGPVPTMPAVVLPDRKIAPPVGQFEDKYDEIHPIAPPGRQEALLLPPAPTTIHWVRQTEHFPVPTESIIHLPTGAAAKIPRIQHKFNDETPDAKINREKRQSKVKEEFKKAWSGYKQHAWLHDELSPVTGNFRDPFCGWAATLVDALDTLWIMGLEEEFEDAVKGVEKIDFTTSTIRSDIPMFETTIRYLGGMLAAYDVSGGKYRILLDKAVELADIMMGAFDTPNRMPTLYYQWKPDFASQPRRASTRSSLAELGSLSMEFTRLAQLTKEPRYYDAVARITNALSEWQDRNTTKLSGVFPESVDASGCNRTVPAVVQQPIGGSQESYTGPSAGEAPVGYRPENPTNEIEPKPQKPSTNTASELVIDIIEDQPALGKAKIAGWDENRQVDKLGNNKRSFDGPPELDTTQTPKIHPISGLPLDIQARQPLLDDNWDCVPQGLDTATPWGFDKFSMAGGQDSTYEYFPKQYLLLGGRDETYKKLYLKTVEAIRRWMLYRPMVPDNRDILFSGAVSTSGNPEKDLSLLAEVEHLTCFIGGMIGMGAKIFGIDGDLEIAKKLADGCVWAYESTVSGIMPEGSTVIPCESAQNCVWNQTIYDKHLDPMTDQRDALLAKYIAKKAKEDAAEEVRKAAVAAADAEEWRRIAAGEESEEAAPSNSSSRVREKRQLGLSQEVSTADLLPEAVGYQKEVQETNDQLNNGPVGHQGEPALPRLPATQTYMGPATPTRDPFQPLSRKEYLDQRIKSMSLPPGFVGVRSKVYILR